jgi:hypothetical protein
LVPGSGTGSPQQPPLEATNFGTKTLAGKVDVAFRRREEECPARVISASGGVAAAGGGPTGPTKAVEIVAVLVYERVRALL